MAGCGPSVRGRACTDLGHLEGIPAWHPWALGLGLQWDHADSYGAEIHLT